MLVRRPFRNVCLVLLAMCCSLSPRLALAEQDGAAAVESASGESKGDLEIYMEILSGRALPVALRQKTAIRLLQGGWPQGIKRMLTILADSEDPQGQLAVAEALVETLPKLAPLPSEFMEPLITLLSAKDEELRQAAALAVANYSQEVLPELRQMILQPGLNVSENTRSAAITAVERIKDKKSVKILIDALNEQNTQLSARCRQGLEYLTGIRFGDSNAAWRQWWQQYKDKELWEWLPLFIDALDNQNRQLQKHVDLLKQQLREQIEARWQTAQDKPRLLEALLSNELEDVRLQGLNLARDLLQPGPFPAQLQERIRQMVQMVTEPSADVRALAADLLRDLGDKQAGKIILQQLPEETDPKVRASFAEALGYVGGAEAVDPLINLLANPVPGVVAKAALALGKLASVEGVRPLRDSIGQALLDRYKKTPSANGDDGVLRSKILSAMVQVGSSSFRPVFVQALQASSAPIRYAAVEGLRNLPSDNRRKDTLGSVLLLLPDSDRGVRLQVLLAIEDLGDAEELGTLEQRLDPKVETDPLVRKEIWRVITKLLTKADLATLTDWELKTGDQDSADRHEQVLRILENKLVESPSGLAELIGIREKYGDCLSKLERWEEASAKYRLAYEQAKDNPLSELRARLALKLLGTLLQQAAFGQVGEHLKDVVATQPTLQEKALDATLSHLETLVDQAATSKQVDAPLELISALEAASLPGLTQQPLANRLAKLKAAANKIQQKADKDLVLQNIDRLARAPGNSEGLTEARTAIGKLGLKRAAKHLLDELERLLGSPNSNVDREKALVGLLAGLDKGFSGYDSKAPLEQRQAVLKQWQDFFRTVTSQERP